MKFKKRLQAFHTYHWYKKIDYTPKYVRIGTMNNGRWKKSKLFTLEKFKKEILSRELPTIKEVKKYSSPTIGDYLFRPFKAYRKELLNKGFIAGRNAQMLEISLELETQIDEV